MDIDPKASFSILLAEARRRVDGVAMYLACGAFASYGAIAGIRNLIAGLDSFIAWKASVSSLLMIPITILLYFALAFYSACGSKFHRRINAGCLLAIPMYFFWKFL